MREHFFQTQDVIGHARFHRWHKGPAIDKYGRNWVLLQFQLIYWQPGSRTRAIP